MRFFLDRFLLFFFFFTAAFSLFSPRGWPPLPPATHPRNRRISRRRKSTVQKYDQPYVKKPPQRGYSGVSGNHHPGHAVLDNVNNKILTFSSMPNCRYDRSFRSSSSPPPPSLRPFRPPSKQQIRLDTVLYTYIHIYIFFFRANNSSPLPIPIR